MIFEAFTTILAPVSILLIPGVALLPLWRHERPLLAWSLISITSLCSVVILSALAALIGVPQLYVFLVLCLITVVALLVQHRQLRHIQNWYSLAAPLVMGAVLLLLFSLPYLFVHDGLPTGDIQKSIIWAQEIVKTKHVPVYGRAIFDLNRDPVDFYTPGLHTALAYVMSLNDSLTTTGFFAIAIALAVVCLAMALAQQLFPRAPQLPLILSTAFLLVTNVRFLRYLREPGYHVQNSVGEFFLFATILLGVVLLRRWRWHEAVLAGSSLLALALVHQFSMFIAAFILLPFAAAFVWLYIRQPRSPVALAIPIAVACIVGILGFATGLHQKIPHLFSATPHLLDTTPSFTEYFSLLGPVWFASGILGLGLLFLAIGKNRENRTVHVVFMASCVVFLLLSQAPRLFIDVPPVRALFYSVVPLSITGAYMLVRSMQLWRTAPFSRLFSVILVVTIVSGGYFSVTSAYGLSHTVRTNSTLLPEQLALSDALRRVETSSGILVDDYNRRSSSWLVLSNHPMFTRIASDIVLHMAEAKQSPLRNRLYQNQLAFEKIYSLGSHPAVATLMKDQNIGFVTGIHGSSYDAFSHNPALDLFASGGDVTIYQAAKNRSPKQTCQPMQKLQLNPQQTTWLLQPTTLVNDIGDPEDTFAHLPASIRSSRVSIPLAEGGCTYRTSNAQYIKLAFNVGDYVQSVWDPDSDNLSATDFTLLVQLSAPLSAPLTLHTATGAAYTTSTDTTQLRISAKDAPLPEDGFITFLIENPTHQLVSLDLIALGLTDTL